MPTFPRFVVVFKTARSPLAAVSAVESSSAHTGRKAIERTLGWVLTETTSTH